jgi:hypothetical protein
MPAFQIWLIWRGRTTRNRVDLENCRVHRDAKKTRDVYVLLQPYTLLRYRYDCGHIHDARDVLESACAARAMNAMQLKCLHVKDPVLPD